MSRTLTRLKGKNAIRIVPGGICLIGLARERMGCSVPHIEFEKLFGTVDSSARGLKLPRWCLFNSLESLGDGESQAQSRYV